MHFILLNIWIYKLKEMSYVDIEHNTNTLWLCLRLNHGAVSQHMEHTTSHLDLQTIKEPSDFLEAFINRILCV